MAQILKLDRKGLKGREIVESIGFSETTVSNVLRENGRRRHMPKGQRKPRRLVGLTHRRTCVKCGKVEMVRSDRKHTKHCRACALLISKFPLGHQPHNKGSTERQRVRKCEVCGGEFRVSQGTMDAALRRGIKRGTYCSKACYGIAMQTPGSRYSEVGKNYPSRRR